MCEESRSSRRESQNAHSRHLSFNVYRFIYSRDSLLTLFPTPGPGATLTNHLRTFRQMPSQSQRRAQMARRPASVRLPRSRSSLGWSCTVRSASPCISTPPAPPAYHSHRPAPSMRPSSPRASQHASSRIAQHLHRAFLTHLTAFLVRLTGSFILRR